MGITVVGSSPERTKELQGIANKLMSKNNYSTHAIMHYLGMHKNVSASLYEDNGALTMHCKDR